MTFLYSEDRHRGARLVADLFFLALGASLIALAWKADLQWCERHLLALYWAYDAHERRAAAAYRVIALALGLVLLAFVRPRVGRWAGRTPPAEALGAIARIGLAMLLALVAAEGALRILQNDRRTRTLLQGRLGEKHPRYGWIWSGPRATTVELSGRQIEYAFNADHDRVKHPSDAPDPARPTILFAGESMTAGHGLHYDETYPAIVGETLGLQTVNLAVHGYGCDQAFLRLVDALPRFEHPVAVVTFFIEASLARLESDDHPHITFDGLEVKVAPGGRLWRKLRVGQVLHDLVPYRDDSPIQLAAQIFRATDALARAKGARAIFVAPRFGYAEPRGDAYVIDELFTKQGLTVVDVDIGNRPIPGDPLFPKHPNAEATRDLAEAVANALARERAGL